MNIIILRICTILAAFVLSACGGDPATQATDAQNSGAQDSSVQVSNKDQTERPQAVLAEPTQKAESAASAKHQETLKVYINAAAKQCEYTGHPVIKTEEKLSDKGIRVLYSECGQITGLMMPAVCGAGMPKINIHTIHADDLPAAKALGFATLKSLVDESKGTHFELDVCTDRGKSSPQQQPM